MSTEFLVAVGDALAQEVAGPDPGGHGGRQPTPGQGPPDGRHHRLRGDHGSTWSGSGTAGPRWSPSTRPPTGCPRDQRRRLKEALAPRLSTWSTWATPRIGIVTVGEDLTEADQAHADQRSVGWREALGAAGVEPVVAHATLARHRRLRRGPRALDRPDRPTALLCFSDVFAAQAIRAAEDLGLMVHADVSVIGYDDADFASTIRPALTTVRQVVDKGRTAVAALLALIDGKDPEPSPCAPSGRPQSTAPVPTGRPAPGLAP